MLLMVILASLPGLHACGGDSSTQEDAAIPGESQSTVVSVGEASSEDDDQSAAQSAGFPSLPPSLINDPVAASLHQLFSTGGPCPAVVLSTIQVPLFSVGAATPDSDPVETALFAWTVAAALVTAADVPAELSEIAAAYRNAYVSFADELGSNTIRDAVNGDAEALRKFTEAVRNVEVQGESLDRETVEKYLAQNCEALLTELGLWDLFSENT